jgi:hypothetical protein
VDTKEKKKESWHYFKKMDELQQTIEEIQLSKPISILNLVKYSKQAYYSKSEYYDLPATQEQSFFIWVSCKKTPTKNTQNNIMKSYVDSTGQVARITTFMRYIGTGNMAKIEQKL